MTNLERKMAKLKTNFWSQEISFGTKVSDMPTFWLVAPNAGKAGIQKYILDYRKCENTAQERYHIKYTQLPLPNLSLHPPTCIVMLRYFTTK